MDYHKLITRYKQFGGIRLVWQYAKLGVLPIVLMCFVKCVIKRQSFKAIYPEVLMRIEPFLAEQFQASRFRIQANEQSHEHPNVIWWCWLQGIENAPDIIRACYNSLVKGEWFNVHGYKFIVIDTETWKQYVELPDHIVKKWEKKQIPPALFTDLLRLQLLIKYGGTWIDSTVLFTQKPQKEGVNTNLTNDTKQTVNNQELENYKISSLTNTDDTDLTDEVRAYLEAPLFLFQYTPEGTTKEISISNWFISAHSNNEVLMVLRDMLFAYWKDYSCTLDYYIFHLFFSMVAKEYPKQIAAMPYDYSMNSLVLLHHWGEAFDQKKWDKLTSKVAFHKLAFRISDNVRNNENNFYHYILNTNLADDTNRRTQAKIQQER